MHCWMHYWLHCCKPIRGFRPAGPEEEENRINRQENDANGSRRAQVNQCAARSGDGDTIPMVAYHHQRHLKVLKSCLSTFNSGKTSVKGNEAKNLKSCRNFMKIDEYDFQKIASTLSEDRLKINSESPIALKEEIKNKTERVTKTIDSTTERESNLLLY